MTNDSHPPKISVIPKRLSVKNILFAVAILLFTACAHHRDVRPGVDGVHRVVVTDDDKEQGSRNPIDQANHYCKQSNRSAAFVEESNKYTGTMDEGSYKTAKALSKAAAAASGSVYVMGTKKEANMGGIIGSGGAIANGALGNE